MKKIMTYLTHILNLNPELTAMSALWRINPLHHLGVLCAFLTRHNIYATAVARNVFRLPSSLMPSAKCLTCLGVVLGRSLMPSLLLLLTVPASAAPLNLQGDLNVAGNATIGTNLTVNGGLHITGLSDFGRNTITNIVQLYVSDYRIGNWFTGLTLSQGNPSATTNRLLSFRRSDRRADFQNMNLFNIQDLHVNGNATIATNLSVAGDVSVSGTLTVNGANVATTADLTNVARTDQANVFTGDQTVGNLTANGVVSGSRFGVSAGQNAFLTNSVAVGPIAGANASANYLTAMGYRAADSSHGDFNTAVGFYAGKEAAGTYWTAIGYHAGYSAEGDNWIAIGKDAAGGGGVNGTNFIAIGSAAGLQVPSGSQGWTAIGNAAGNIARGDGWGAYGNNAGRWSFATNSHFFGNWAGRSATGNNCLYVDVYNADPGYATLSGGSTNDMIFGDNGYLYLGRGTGAPSGSQGGTLRGNWSVSGAIYIQPQGNLDMGPYGN